MLVGRRVLLLLLTAAAGGAWSTGAAFQTASVTTLIRQRLDAAVRRPPAPAADAELSALYRRAADAPLWLTAGGEINRNAREALALLASASDDGLDADDYAAPALGRLAAAIDADAPVNAGMLADFELTMSAGMLRFLHDLNGERLDPRAIGLKPPPRETRDSIALLLSALNSHRVADAAAAVRPSGPQYARLREMLRRYRALAAEPPLSFPNVSKKVEPGGAYDGLAALATYLAAVGDMPAMPGGAVPARYEGALVAGVTRFQRRHGLTADGVIGARTISALRVPLAWRERQIELALERLRWLPSFAEAPVVIVNIPMFQLRAWDLGPGRAAPARMMNVIVGRARLETPVFAATVKEVTFRPYWNVPRSILVHEILPAMAKTPGYLRRNDMEIVRGDSDEAAIVDDTPDNVAALARGELRVRQRPGAANSLGLIKFSLTNSPGVYLHGTPQPALFERERRDLSHGCVRVADPVGLATWVLADRPEWTVPRMQAAMEGDGPLRVNVTRLIPVLFLYTTAVFVIEDDTLHFADDIYRQDARLDRALSSPRAPLRVPPALTEAR